MTVPEFHRPHRLDQIGAGESSLTVTADAAERAALAERFDLQAIDSLQASYKLRSEAGGVRATGHLSAKVVQSCVVTGDPVPAAVDEDFDIRFLPEGSSSDSDEVELSEDECDTVFFTGGAIDLGEAAAETLALALDPFPRSPAAGETLKTAGVISEDEAEALKAKESSPFGALAGLKDQLSKD
ncbi:DUF177 domain-containing protein [Sphingomonas sp. AOB5]|uniref:YceD family protein n=1 Tax=Sphingomonas sp. AOB5 TaxID=3034017 RepID=UPI0023F81AD4|nr:DUF177 domain-containing protein [Sphingomonas sp. AOB5]MDF7776070.1 DUF177 domain-containing protein [Sphingomonas sp. AOB5]